MEHKVDLKEVRHLRNELARKLKNAAQQLMDCTCARDCNAVLTVLRKEREALANAFTALELAADPAYAARAAAVVAIDSGDCE